MWNMQTILHVMDLPKCPSLVVAKVEDKVCEGQTIVWAITVEPKSLVAAVSHLR